MKKELKSDVVLIGAGIMSATLGALLKQLQPDWSITILERMDAAATESSEAWNNAGTGHSAFCELNYTPEKADGSIDISKAVKVAENFEVSRQFWSSLSDLGILPHPSSFITSIPHMSFVWGDENVDYLRKRYEAMIKSPLFEDMEYSDSFEQLQEWIPLMMKGRNADEPLAATRMRYGTDVNFGMLTRSLFQYLQEQKDVRMYFQYEVNDIERNGRDWVIEAQGEKDGKLKLRAPFVFIGAGGGSLPLLLKSGIPESKGYGGFPVSGQWLKCINPDVIETHQAKVYGKAEVGSPPMSVPHLDTRFINGKQELLFGPYAGFSTRFLKHGSVLDLFRSVRFSNIRPMVLAGVHNIPLTKYLIEQVRQSDEERVEALRKFYPQARKEDWELEIAGQRVQVIKKDEKEGGILEFGTEVVSAADGSIAALLGASPGASTAVSIMFDLLNKCFPMEMKTETWKSRIKSLVPSYGQELNHDRSLLKALRARTSSALHLQDS